MIYRETEHARTLKERTRSSIVLATEGKWAEAAQLNREILEACPDNVPALNRLGRALIELGRVDEARRTFQNALQIDPANDIAASHVARLNWASEQLAAAHPNPPARPGVSAKMFTGDSGKSAEVTLLASARAPHLSPGALVSLLPDGPRLLAIDPSGACLGLVPPKVARRLASLIAGGNRYHGAISGQTNGAVRVVLRETYQHPSQRSKVSFPPLPEPESSQLAHPETDPATPPETPPDDDAPAILEFVGAGAPLDDFPLPDILDDDP